MIKSFSGFSKFLQKKFWTLLIEILEGIWCTTVSTLGNECCELLTTLKNHQRREHGDNKLEWFCDLIRYHQNLNGFDFMIWIWFGSYFDAHVKRQAPLLDARNEASLLLIILKILINQFDGFISKAQHSFGFFLVSHTEIWFNLDPLAEPKLSL